MVRLFLLFFATASLSTGFQIQPTRLETLYTDGASKTALCQSECSNEVTRRDAILASTAAASLTVATSVPASCCCQG